MAWAEFRPTRLLRRLADGGVDFVVIGGFAAVAHGSVTITHDLDIVYATDPANLERLGTVLVRLDARLRGVAETVPFIPDERTLRRTQVLTLDTPDGPLDLLAEPDGARSYDLLRANALRVAVAGVEVLVASLEDLLAMKRASGRPKDLLAVGELEAIARLERRGRG